LPPNNQVKQFISVHVVISQYVIENITPHEFIASFKNINSIMRELQKLYDNVFAIENEHSAPDYLKYRFNKIIFDMFPLHMKTICFCAILQPLQVQHLLQTLQDILLNQQNVTKFLNPVCIDIDRLIIDCISALRNAPKACRSLNQSVQRYLMRGDYNNIVKAIKNHIDRNPICLIAKKSLSVLLKLIPNCDSCAQHCIKTSCEELQLLLPEYHKITVQHLQVAIKQ